MARVDWVVMAMRTTLPKRRRWLSPVQPVVAVAPAAAVEQGALVAAAATSPSIISAPNPKLSPLEIAGMPFTHRAWAGSADKAAPADKVASAEEGVPGRSIILSWAMPVAEGMVVSAVSAVPEVLAVSVARSRSRMPNIWELSAPATPQPFLRKVLVPSVVLRVQVAMVAVRGSKARAVTTRSAHHS